MFSKEEIDAVLHDAQAAVEDLSRDVSRIAGHGGVGVAEPLRRSSAQAPSAPAGRVQRILKLRVPVRVQLAQRSMPVAEILHIAPGTILEFDQNVSKDLSLLVNNRRIGQGVAVKVGEHFGIRITRVGDVASRIQSLGS